MRVQAGMAGKRGRGRKEAVRPRRSALGLAQPCFVERQSQTGGLGGAGQERYGYQAEQRRVVIEMSGRRIGEPEAGRLQPGGGSPR